MKTNIQVREVTRNKLSKLKYELNCSDYDAVVSRLLKLVSHFKMNQELKDLK